MKYENSEVKFKKANTKKIKFEKPKSDAAKRAWKKIRLLVKFWSFPKWFYTREFQKVTKLRTIILDFQGEHW